MSNKLIIAAAGSGKTTHLVDEALKITTQKILITTYTEANELEIRKKIIEKNKFIPSNITVQTWFSFLLQHGVRPYQSCLFKMLIRGMRLINKQSARGIPESNVEKHYFDKTHKIYSDKVAKFIVKCNEICAGKIISRLSKIYSQIFIDEVQDLAGYDLVFLQLLFESSINTLLVLDPRQSTYKTNNSNKNSKYEGAAIVDFFKIKSLNVEIDDVTLNKSHRCTPKICDFSNKLFPEYLGTKSCNFTTTGHDGIFLVRKKDLPKYIDMYKPIMQLRDKKNKIIENDMPAMNFGESKGLGFDRVIIYPTKPILNWLKNNSNPLSAGGRSKFYVALTRARYSVAIIYDYKDNEFPDIQKFVMPSSTKAALPDHFINLELPL